MFKRNGDLSTHKCDEKKDKNTVKALISIILSSYVLQNKVEVLTVRDASYIMY